MNFLCGEEPVSGDHVTTVNVARDEVEQELDYGRNTPFYTELTSVHQTNAKKHEVFNVTSNCLMAGGCTALKIDHVTSRDLGHCERLAEGALTETVNTDHVTLSSDLFTYVDPQSRDEIAKERLCGNGDVRDDVHHPPMSRMTSDTRTIIDKQLLDNDTSSESAYRWSMTSNPSSGSTTKYNMTSSNCAKYTSKSRQREILGKSYI